MCENLLTHLGDMSRSGCPVSITGIEKDSGGWYGLFAVFVIGLVGLSLIRVFSFVQVKEGIRWKYTCRT